MTQKQYIFKIERKDGSRTIYRILATRKEAEAQFEMETDQFEGSEPGDRGSVEVYRGSSCYPPTPMVFSYGMPIMEAGR